MSKVGRVAVSLTQSDSVSSCQYVVEYTGVDGSVFNRFVYILLCSPSIAVVVDVPAVTVVEWLCRRESCRRETNRDMLTCLERGGEREKLCVVCSTPR